MQNVDRTRVIYEWGKFRLDPEERTLFSDGEALHLPAKEFETLLYLVEHNGHAVSKEEMMSAIWSDAFVEESNLAKQISRLRKILNTNDSQAIETIPKHGYRFSAELRQISPVIDSPIIVERRTMRRLTVEEPEADTARPVKALPPKPAFLTWKKAAALCLLVAVGIAAIYWLWLRRSGPLPIRTIAVLPLRPLAADEDSKALGLGLSDALITQLGGLKRVVVRPINAVASTPADSDPIAVGRELNVDAVLEGTIQQADGRLRVNARLLSVDTGEQIWGDRFDQPATQIFAIQDAMSSDIAEALAFELSRENTEQLAHRGTQNTEAYEKYLRGRYFLSQNTRDGFDQAIDRFQEAAALDPNFAEAYVGIGDTYLLFFNFGYATKDFCMPPAREAINKALRLNPDLPGAYTANALIQFLADKDWPASEQSLKRAIEIDPNYADAFIRYGYFLIGVGRYDDAISKLERARELNPLSPVVNTDLGLAYLADRNYPRAIEQLERTSSENPRFSLPLWLLGLAYESVGNKEKAFEANLKAAAIENSDENSFLDELRKIHDQQGTDAANGWWLDQSIKFQQERKIPPIFIAGRAATLADREATLHWIEQAVTEDDPTLSQIKYMAKFDFVRDDPRFQDAVKKIGY